MVDSSDRARIAEARQELHRIMTDNEMKQALLLVFANKQDIQGSMSVHEVSKSLKLEDLKGTIFNVLPSCATTGDGIPQGLVSRGLISSFWMLRLC